MSRILQDHPLGGLGPESSWAVRAVGKLRPGWLEHSWIQRVSIKFSALQMSFPSGISQLMDRNAGPRKVQVRRWRLGLGALKEYKDINFYLPEGQADMR